MIFVVLFHNLVVYVGLNSSLRTRCTPRCESQVIGGIGDEDLSRKQLFRRSSYYLTYMIDNWLFATILTHSDNLTGYESQNS